MFFKIIRTRNQEVTKRILPENILRRCFKQKLCCWMKRRSETVSQQLIDRFLYQKLANSGVIYRQDVSITFTQKYFPIIKVLHSHILKVTKYPKTS